MLWIALTHTPPHTPPPPDSACWWALAYTPRVCRLDGALLLEVRASLRLFGGQDAFLSRLATEAAAWGWGHLATAHTGHAALVLSRHPRPHLDQAPAAGLPATQTLATTLDRLGCHTLGQLRRLPRAGVTRRLGAAVLHNLDQAYGNAPESWDWLQAPVGFEAHQEWPWHLDSTGALLASLEPHWRALRSWLVGRQQGLTQLQVVWTYAPRRHGVPPPAPLVVRTALATQDTTHLEYLVRERLNRTTLAAPVVRTGLVVDATEPLASATHPLLATANQHSAWDRHELLERLVSRLGQDQVRQGHWQADPRPEHTHPWHPCTAEEPSRAPTLHPTEHLWPADWASQPPWLVDPPLRLSTQGERPVYQGPLTLLTRAQRVETGWWHTETTQRDYFVASSPQAGLVWVYRERGGDNHGGWYLQGLYG